MTPSTAYSSKILSRDDRSAALRAADALRLAAAPTFAIMALLTIVGGGAHEIWCCMESHRAVPTGMIPMYLLMSLFHLPHWLKLISIRRAHARAAGRALNPSI
jgi:hypothetical protein